MKKAFVLIFIIFSLIQIKAQALNKTSIDVAVGYGLSAPYDDIDITDSGFYLQGEYVLTLAKWIDVRPYVGFIFTKAGTNNNQLVGLDYKSSTKALLLGGKTRITAPIPWVAPYLEGGIGASIGTFETLTPFTDIEKKGIIFHIPFSIGLELGPKRNFDIAFTYYFQPSVEQFAGAAAFGISIPLNKNR